MSSRHFDERRQAFQGKEETVPPGQNNERTDEHTPVSETARSKSINKQREEKAEGAVEEAREEVAASKRRWYQTIYWGRVLLFVYAILLGFFVLLAWWVHIHPILAIDVTITREFQENQSPWLRSFMIAVSYLGVYPMLFTALVIVTAIIFWVVRLQLEALLVLFSCGTEALLNEAIKIIVARPRPSDRLVDVITRAQGLSFPSGHVMSYVAYWGVLFSLAIILFKGNRWWRIGLLIIPALFIVLVGPSRIYLGDHWATDVLGGYIFGGIWLGICLWIYLKLRERGILNPKRKRHRHHHLQSPESGTG